MGLIDYKFNRRLNILWAFKKFAPYEEKETGVIVFCGRQGSGKTTSLAEELLTKIEYYGKEKVKIYSNMPLYGVDYTDIFAEDIYFLQLDPSFQNILVLDEISSIFTALSSSRLSGNVYQAFCQLRKRGALVLGTAQRFDRISTAIREQCNIIVDCKRIGRLQFNKVYNIENGEQDDAIAKPETFYCFFPTPEIYSTFDSGHIIKRKEISKNE